MSLYLLSGLAAVAGLINAMSLAWPWSEALSYGAPTWLLQWIAMIGFVALLHATRTPLHAAVLGFVFQFATLVTSLSWLEISMHQFGGIPAFMAWAAVALLAAFLSLYVGVAVGLWKMLDRTHTVGASVLFGALWLMAEMARGQWLSGFGWANIAYAHVEGPFSVLVPWGGGYGLSAAVAATSAFLVALARNPSPKGLLPIALAMGLWGILGNLGHFSRPTGGLTVALLQGNIPQDEKFVASTGVADALDWYGKELKRTRTDLVLAPETAIPVLLQQLPDAYWSGWPPTTSSETTVRLIGMPLGDARNGYTNSVVGFSTPDDGSIWYRYDKHHLVPFGEFIPPLFKWFVRMMNIPLGDFERGGIAQAPIRVGSERVAPAICFEDLFSEELAARFREPEQSPTVLANFSNLAWFGDSTAMHQHLSISRMRSKEFERPSLRVSNTGVTAIVDYDGTVIATLPPLTRGVLQGVVQGQTGLTPYAWWSSRWGQLPLWGIALAILLLACFARRRRSC